MNVSSLQILSVGDLITNGTYFLHSSFKSLSNYVSNKRLVALANRTHSPGPSTIVLDCCELPSAETIIIEDYALFINELKYIYKIDQIYLSSVSLSNIKHEIFYNNINFFKQLVLELSPADSIPGLLKRPLLELTTTGFEAALRIALKTGIGHFQHRRYVEGAINLKGLGIGLTPSGDDFIAGFLWGLFCRENLHKTDCAAIRDLIFLNAQTENLISQSQLADVRENRAGADLRCLTESIAYKDEGNVEESAHRFFSIGAASPFDFSAGLLFGVFDNPF
jgi:hypothetical protein